ncbi:PEP/pyruvate-binding domain-containing protein [Streptomyces sp. NRRL F-2747]|uniref:PEP/pyruvate-binding domain-containing protein n=1 Tax=Streptomyces sp. NRRL F-2747 TaxID=1463843 RepID=UPI0004C5CC4E|nr:PEP/pyruvate-binding domain-containing protein [Streptomyces sp. NRRL F-2747]
MVFVLSWDAGRSALLAAVRRCRASLWTDRALAYRARAGIAHEDVSLAVVVQELVAADTAGVMFTVDPLGGRGDRLVVNAAWGLGEAVEFRWTSANLGEAVPDVMTPATWSFGKAFMGDVMVGELRARVAAAATAGDLTALWASQVARCFRRGCHMLQAATRQGGDSLVKVRGTLESLVGEEDAALRLARQTTARAAAWDRLATASMPRPDNQRTKG